MTAQEIIEHFKQERRRFAIMRAENADADRHYLWDDLHKHISSFLNEVDSRRQVITDEQLAEAMKL